MSHPSDAAKTDWKDKYFRALNDFDDQQRQWQAHSSQLTRRVRALADSLRSHDLRFSAAVEKLDSHDQDIDPTPACVQVLQEATSYVDSLPAAPGVADESNAGTTQNTDNELLQALGAACGQQQVFDGFVHQLHNCRDEISRAERLQHIATEAAAALGHGQALSSTTVQTLTTLLQQLNLPQAEATTLLEALKPAGCEAEQKQAIRQFARELDRYIASLHNEINNLRGFLKAVNAQLLDFSSRLKADADEEQSANAAQTVLNDSVTENLAAIRSDIADSSDLESLKHTIETQIAGLATHLKQFVRGESARRQRRQDNNRKIDQDVHKLHAETDALRHELDALRERAFHDALTGLPNRHAYDERLQLELNKRHHSGQALTMAVLDLDHFKAVNDEFGHQTGDRVLKHVAKVLEQRLRSHDFLARFGGEEFVVLLPATALPGAIQVIDELRKHIAHSRFKFKQTPLSITVSCGVADFSPADSPEEVFARADQALYAAKQRGRNRTEASPGNTAG